MINTFISQQWLRIEKNYFLSEKLIFLKCWFTLELTFDMLQIKITRIFLLVLFPRAMTHKGHIYLFDLAINGNIPDPLICAPNL